MGKQMLFITGAVILGTVMLLFGAKQRTVDTQAEQGEYQFDVIARDVAESGFEKALSAVRRDLMSVERSRQDVSMQNGTFGFEITEKIYGDLDIAVGGESGEADHSIQANVIFETPFPGAVGLYDQTLKINDYGTSYSISGIDARAPSRGSGDGYLRPVYGVVTDEHHLVYAMNTLEAASVVGQDDQGSITGGFDKAYYEALYQEAVTHPQVQVVSGGTAGIVAESDVVDALDGSSADDPKIIRALGDLTVASSLQGHGMLIVEDGDLKVTSNDFNWEGLVMVRRQAVDTVNVEFSGASKVHGGVVAYGVDAAPSCAAGFTISGNETVVTEDFTVRIEVLGAAISYGGQYDMPVTTQFDIGGTIYEPFGSWGLPLDGNVNTGNTGETHVWEPGTIFPANTSIKIHGRSWKKKRRRSGASNSDWTMHMEKTSVSVDDQLAVLKDTSPVPDVGGYNGQYSVEDFLDGYINTVTDEMTLDDGQSIYLFELGVNNPNSAAHDMQDLVVLVTMKGAGEGTCLEDLGKTVRRKTELDAGGGTIISNNDNDDDDDEYYLGDGTTLITQSAIGGIGYLGFTMGGTAEIRYSGEAIAKLGQRLNLIEQAALVVVSNRENVKVDATATQTTQ